MTIFGSFFVIFIYPLSVGSDSIHDRVPLLGRQVQDGVRILDLLRQLSNKVGASKVRKHLLGRPVRPPVLLQDPLPMSNLEFDAVLVACECQKHIGGSKRAIDALTSDVERVAPCRPKRRAEVHPIFV